MVACQEYLCQFQGLPDKGLQSRGGNLYYEDDVDRRVRREVRNVLEPELSSSLFRSLPLPFSLSRFPPSSLLRLEVPRGKSPCSWCGVVSRTRQSNAGVCVLLGGRSNNYFGTSYIPREEASCVFLTDGPNGRAAYWFMRHTSNQVLLVLIVGGGSVERSVAGKSLRGDFSVTFLC